MYQPNLDDLPILNTDTLDDFPTTVFGIRKSDIKLNLVERLIMAQTRIQGGEYHAYTAAGGGVYGVVDADSVTFPQSGKAALISSITVVQFAHTGTPVARFGYYNTATGVVTNLTAWELLADGVNTLTLTQTTIPSGTNYVPILFVSAYNAGETSDFAATLRIVYTEV